MAFAIVLGTFLVILISRWAYRWRNPRCNGVLPPGSMGLPIIGESIDYFTPYLKDDVPLFIRKRVSKYGPLFRTSIVGQPVVVSTDPEVNYYVFQQEGNIFQCWYSESVNRIIGKQSMAVQQGVVHKYLKNLILSLVGPENLKEKLILEMDQNTQQHLHSWANLGNLDAKEATAEMVFTLAARKILNYDDKKASQELRDCYKAFLDGFISFPLYIPGTAFYACIQGRRKALKVIKSIFNERRASMEKKAKNDFVDAVLEEVDSKGSFLNEEIALDLVFLLLFASHETTSTAMTLAMKYLSQHPAVLAELVREHEAILNNRETEAGSSSAITWKEYKSMTFTHMIINETVRLANIAPGIFRKVMKEVEIKGYTIPEGWTLMVCPSSVHMNADKYEDPLAFNPWRWEGQELHSASKNFMAFGGGMRLCVGADFAKLQMAIFLHYLVTKYRWVITGGGNTIRKPGLLFPDGFHVHISNKADA